MMGHVINLLTKFIEESGGPQAVEAAYARAGLPRREYRFDTAYPEEEFSRLLLAAIATLGATSEQAEDGFARFFMRVSPEIFPAVFRQAGNARSMLERIPEIHRSIPAAASRSDLLDKLKVHESRPHELVYSYCSPHRLCRFLRSTCELVLEHYGEQGEVRELECAKDGAPACLVEIHFGPPRMQ